MKLGKLYKIENIEVGAFGFGNGNIGLVLKNQNVIYYNHGISKTNRGIYVLNDQRIIWKLNTDFIKPTFKEKINFYLNFYFKKT